MGLMWFLGGARSSHFPYVLFGRKCVAEVFVTRFDELRYFKRIFGEGDAV
jgi:hypothetical protein